MVQSRKYTATHLHELEYFHEAVRQSCRDPSLYANFTWYLHKQSDDFTTRATNTSHIAESSVAASLHSFFRPPSPQKCGAWSCTITEAFWLMSWPYHQNATPSFSRTDQIIKSIIHETMASLAKWNPLAFAFLVLPGASITPITPSKNCSGAVL